MQKLVKVLCKVLEM